MRYQTKRFKCMAIALRELEPFIAAGAHLKTGKGFKKFGDLRSRELVANWLICAAVNSEDRRKRAATSHAVCRGQGINDALCLDGQLDAAFERKATVHRYPRRRMSSAHFDRGSERHHRCVEDVHVHPAQAQSWAKVVGVFRQL